MPQTCDLCKKSMTEAIAAAGPIDPPDEALSHLIGCEGCMSWFDEQELRDGDEDRLEPLVRRMAVLAVGEGTQEREWLDEMFRETRDRRDGEIAEAIGNFLTLQPVLHPRAWHIDEARYQPTLFFTAMDAVDALLRRSLPKDLSKDAVIELHADGFVAVDGEVLLKSVDTRGEVKRIIAECHRAPDPSLPPPRETDAQLDARVGAVLVVWIMGALRARSGIMRSFTARPDAPPDDTFILLTPRERPVDDAVALWNE